MRTFTTLCCSALLWACGAAAATDAGPAEADAAPSAVDAGADSAGVDAGRAPPTVERYAPGFATCVGPACNPGGSGGEVRILRSTDPRELEAALCTPGRATILPRAAGIVDVESVFERGITCDASDKTFDARGVPYILTGRGLRLTGRGVTALGVTCHGISPLADHEDRRDTVADCVNLRDCTDCVVAYGECFGTVDECFDLETAAGLPSRNLAVLYNRALPGCGTADQTAPACQGGRGHNRWSNCTQSCGDAYWYGNVVLGYTWRIPQVIGTTGAPGSRAAVAYNAILFRGERSTTVDAGRDGASSIADLIGNVYVDGPESLGPQIGSDSGDASVWSTDNTTCDRDAARCAPARVAASLSPAVGPSWPRVTSTLPPIPPAELLSEAYYRERVGPGYVTPIAERVWSAFRDGTLVVGGGYDPATFTPTPLPWTAPPDRDGDGVRDALDRRPDVADAWVDWDGDGVPQLIEQQDGTLEVP